MQGRGSTDRCTKRNPCRAAQGRDVCTYGHYGVGDNPFGADSSQAVFFRVVQRIDVQDRKEITG